MDAKTGGLVVMFLLAGCGEKEPAKKETGGRAYPVVLRTNEPGMTLRDYFAIHNSINHVDGDEATARARYEFADAMLKERSK